MIFSAFPSKSSIKFSHALFAVVLFSGIPAVSDTFELVGTIRDFLDTHPDMERPNADLGSDTGIVESTIEADRKPVYGNHPMGTLSTTGENEFNQWYNDVPAVNLKTSFTITLDSDLSPNPGEFVFDDTSFFPIDDQLFGNQTYDHNFHFTYEIHTSFQFEAGQYFNFTGDDDVWVFINDQLVIDLGGIHMPQSASFSLDTINPPLVPGQVYKWDIFYAERRTLSSSFTIETNIQLFSNDGDEDGVSDDEDNCPDLDNPDQVDTDTDGLGNACDVCPLDADDLMTEDDDESDSDDDGVCNSDDACEGFDDAQDGDQDQIPNDCDLCPIIPNPNCTPGDEDGDQIDDDLDNCPNLDNPSQIDSDSDGIGDECDPVDDNLPNSTRRKRGSGGSLPPYYLPWLNDGFPLGPTIPETSGETESALHATETGPAPDAPSPDASAPVDKKGNEDSAASGCRNLPTDKSSDASSWLFAFSILAWHLLRRNRSSCADSTAIAGAVCIASKSTASH